MAKTETPAYEELVARLNISKPIQGGVALVCLGITLTSVPLALPSIRAVLAGQSLAPEAVVWLLVFAVALVASVILGYNAVIAKRDASTVLTALGKLDLKKLRDASGPHVASARQAPVPKPGAASGTPASSAASQSAQGIPRPVNVGAPSGAKAD